MSTVKHSTLSAREQERRRLAVRRALAHVRMEGLEPDPIFAEYADRYCAGEMTLDDAIADYLRRISATHAAE
ncbi:MAG: antitoxin VbhA family protein [Ktedonobacterales bacterium]